MRARHWLALLAAFSLIVFSWLTNNPGVELEIAATRDLPRLGADLGEWFDEMARRADGQVHGPTKQDDRETGVAGSVALGVTETGSGREPDPDGGFGSVDVPGPVGPLTGLPVDAEVLDRPALVMKIDNHPRARPQTGLDRADVVFDLRAEGVTRFAAVFHSDVPDPLGPVRSSRTSDFDLLRGLNRPLYGSSGGNRFVAGALRDLPITAVTAMTREEYFRNRSRPAPHNLYVNGSDLLDLAPSDAEPPAPWFDYRDEGDDLPPSAAEVDGPVTIDFTGSPTVTHEWDGERAGWRRAQDGTPHTQIDGGGERGEPLAPENVVIMITDYSTSAADPISPEVRSTGTGPAIVLTQGHAIIGEWERRGPTAALTLRSENDEPIELTPGRTWVLMPERGQVDYDTVGSAGSAVTGLVRSPEND